MIPLCEYRLCEQQATLAAEVDRRPGETIVIRSCSEHIHYLWGFLQSACWAGETIRILEKPR